MFDPLAVSLEHAFDIKVEFDDNRCIFGPLPGGHSQGYTPTTGGRIYGPRLSGRVVPNSGADFATVRPDGVIEINSHYLLAVDDGTKIYICNRGYLVMAKPGETIHILPEMGLVHLFEAGSGRRLAA